jgi:cysteine sulfinate desulfinase/cysteine desulfurase-like protein
MGLSEAEARSSLRFSFGRDTTESDVLALTAMLSERVL